MTDNHKTIYALQLLLCAVAIACFSVMNPSPGLVLFIFSLVFFTELALVHCQNKMNPNEIYYRKSCLFAMADLAAASVYCGYFVWFLGVWVFKYSFEYLWWPLIALFSYTLLRKIFIFKNYTYEK